VRTCKECGSHGEGGEMENADGRVWHFRKIAKGGKPYPIRCYGKFVERKHPGDPWPEGK
jgi:hypothetical protein